MKLVNFAIIYGLLAVSTQSHALDMVAEVQRCAAVASDETRLQCFDALSKSLVQAKQTGVDIQQNVVDADKDTDKMSATIGGSRFDEKESDVGPITTGHVTFCQKSYDQKWLFVFDNGQVWKQSDSKSHRFSECDFDVSIDRDFFGYFMLIDDETVSRSSKVRISRKK